jgi:hypothetical protein
MQYLRSRQAQGLLSRDGNALQFLKDEFQTTLKALTKELEALKAENKGTAAA